MISLIFLIRRKIKRSEKVNDNNKLRRVCILNYPPFSLWKNLEFIKIKL
jgi:hypothetical protein